MITERIEQRGGNLQKFNDEIIEIFFEREEEEDRDQFNRRFIFMCVCIYR